MQKICVFGAGAIGSHLAARLAMGGADVSVVARGAQLDAIKQNGITMFANEQRHHVNVAASQNPADLGPQDAIFVTVKAPALPSVAATLAPLLKFDTPVVFVLNGIPWWYSLGVAMEAGNPPQEVDASIHAHVGLERVIGGVIMSPTQVIEPGVINVQGKTQKLMIGEVAGESNGRAEKLAQILEAGGIEMQVSNDIRTIVWDKLIANLMTGPMAVLSRSNYRQILSDPTCRETALKLAYEVAAVATALGCKPNMDMEKRLEFVRDLTHRPSILQDLEAGRLMEVDALVEAPRFMARTAKIAVPTLDVLGSLVKLTASTAGLYKSA